MAHSSDGEDGRCWRGDLVAIYFVAVGTTDRKLEIARRVDDFVASLPASTFFKRENPFTAKQLRKSL